jgi:membrane-bound lytic murein transglycosylase D
LLRNQLILISFIALTGCATATVKQANKETPQNAVPAATQQSTEISTAKTPQQPVPALQIDTPQAVSVTTLPAIAPTAIPFLNANNSDSRQIDVWQRIRNGYGMREQDSKLIARYEQWYASRPEYVTRMTERGQRYLYFIVEEVEKRGMPMEIALLPMIESAFNPGAYSTARASGIWQFIPSTGKHFGMQQNWWYDGRRDVVSATKGALDYLQKLHDQFGEWDLALAAYNCGENSVMRAQAHNRKRHLPTNYASLKLPKETRDYVPKLMAVKNIVSYPDSFGLTLTDVPNKPYFAEVSTSRHIDLQLAAEMAGISVEDFTALNPAHNRPVILLKGDDVLLLPVEKVETFRANLERANQPLVSWQEYPAKKGEDLDHLASRFGITSEKLKSINGLSKNLKVSNGQALLVPLNGVEAENEFTAFNTHLAATDQSLLNAVRHTVRKGDTLSSIARRYHVKLASLQSWNRGVRILRPGQHIMVAQRTQTSPTPRTSKVSHTIKTSTNFKKAKRQTSNS